MTSLPVPLSTAIYAIHDRACLQVDESIIINCDSDRRNAGAEYAAIRIAQQVGAQVFVVCSAPVDRAQILRHVEVPLDRVFTATDLNAATKILSATEGAGVDVILSFATSGLPAVWLGSSSIASICADCARLVQVGSARPGLSNTLVVDPAVLKRNITLTTFDMGSLIARQTPAGQSLCHKLITNAMNTYRSGSLQGLDLSPRIRDVSDIKDSFRELASKTADIEDPFGVVISLENDESLIPVMPIKYDTILSSDKTYLLIGCLGGLGRSMSKWMLSRGARKFVFMGRSGTDKAPARRLVDSLRSLGAQVTVVRGDVVNADDVNRAVCGIIGPIGGVIQAAMGLDVSGIFEVDSYNLHDFLTSADV